VQVRLAEYDRVVHALSADRAQPLDVSVLPGRPSGGRTIADSHRTNAARVCWTECPVAVADQVAWSFIPGESLCHLSGDPFGGRTSSDRKPYQPPTLMTQDHQTKTLNDNSRAAKLRRRLPTWHGEPCSRRCSQVALLTGRRFCRISRSEAAAARSRRRRSHFF